MGSISVTYSPMVAKVQDMVMDSPTGCSVLMLECEEHLKIKGFRSGDLGSQCFGLPQPIHQP